MLSGVRVFVGKGGGGEGGGVGGLREVDVVQVYSPGFSERESRRYKQQKSLKS